MLAWELANSIDARFWVEALETALATYGRPDIFNTDQGSQFTSEAFTSALTAHDIRISMDGKGRWEASPTNMLFLTAFPTPHDRMLRDGYCLRRPSRPRHPFSDHRVASRGSQMTRRAFGMPCSWPSDGVITPPAGQPPGPGPSGGHEKHPGLAATRLTFVFQRCGMAMPQKTSRSCGASP